MRKLGLGSRKLSLLGRKLSLEYGLLCLDLCLQCFHGVSCLQEAQGVTLAPRRRGPTGSRVGGSSRGSGFQCPLNPTDSW